MEIRELLQKRASLWNEAKKFLDAHTDRDGKISAEDAATYDKMEAEFDELSKTIERYERRARIDAELDKPFSEPYFEPFKSAKSRRHSGIAGDEYHRNFIQAFRTNFKNAGDYLREGELNDGGWVVPMSFNEQIVSKLQKENILRQICRVIQTESTHRVPVIATQPSANWIGEGDEITISSANFSSGSQVHY